MVYKFTRPITHGWSPVKQIPCRRERRIEEPNDDPGIWVLMHIAHEKVGVVFVDHLVFKFVAKRLLPIVTILPSPTTVRLPDFPIEAC